MKTAILTIKAVDPSIIIDFLPIIERKLREGFTSGFEGTLSWDTSTEES